MTSQLRIAFFDIGKKNFAQYVEDCDIDELKSLNDRYNQLPKNLQRRVKGNMNPEIEGILNDMYKSSSTLHMGVFDLRNENEENILDYDTRKNIITHLEKYKNWWDTCDIIGIEQQFFTNAPFARSKKSGGANIDAIKISEIVCSWFLMTYPTKDIKNLTSFKNIGTDKHIGFLSAPFKTLILGMPNKCNRKKWAVQKAIEICEIREEKENVEMLTARKKRGATVKKGKNKVTVNKKDDVCDCILSAQALKMKFFIGKF